MRMLRSRAVPAAWFVVVLAVAMAPIPAPRAAGPGSGRFLVISDIHFDPFFDGSLFPRLRDAPVEEWRGILAGSRPSGFNPRGTDSNDALLQSGLDEAQARLPDPDFILYPGDFLAHRWTTKYDALAARSHEEDPEAYRAFTTKVIRYLAAEFRRRFPAAPVLPTLGNDDSFCGDYQITPEGPFLAMFAEVWAPLLGDEVDAAAFRETFGRGGYYERPLPGVAGTRLVVLNTVVCSVDYDNTCGSATQTPALDQFRWLEGTLERAEARGESVWLLMHVPPGLDSFDSAASLGRGGPPVTFWQPELLARFLRIVDRHRSTLRFAFAGHTHMDDFRAVRIDGTPVLPVKIAPAISPIFGNNPGFQVYDHDPRTGTPRDYEAFGLAGFDDPAPDRWEPEYRFREVYGFDDLTAGAIERLARTLAADAAIRAKYADFYDVGAPPAIAGKPLEACVCAVPNATPAEFLRCYDHGPIEREPKLRGR